DAVDQALVHVDVDDVGAGFDLFAGDGERFLVAAVLDEPGEFPRAGDVGPLADHDEVRFGPDHQRLVAAVGRPGRQVRDLPGRDALDRQGDGVDPLRRGAAAAADDVD